MRSPQTHYLSRQNTPKTISGVLRIALVTLFALLWAIWIQPHTIALRQIVLTLGSLLGLYVISKNLHLFKARLVMPIYLIGLLFAWITFHLFFLSNQYELQLAEYLTIWKRIAWAAPFAIGLGIVLGQSQYSSSSNKYDAHKELLDHSRIFWIFYAGIVMPTAIYLVRSVLMMLASKLGWHLPSLAMHWPPSSTWHITKMSIVFFCLPALALACSQLIRLNSQKNMSPFFSSILYGATIVAVLMVFFLENTKNGIAYSVVLISAAFLKIAINKRGQWRWRDALIATVAVVALTFLVVHHVQKNDSWKTLFADLTVAEQLEKIDAWKDYGARGYPVNELGAMVSETNYLRAVWARVALGFIQDMPLGYGLVYKSFGHIAAEKWPESTLFQAHSAWLDLTLGIGVPGVLLLLMAGVIALKNAIQNTTCIWGAIALWMISGIAILMLTTEVSQQIYLDALVFLILWAAGIGLQKNRPFAKGFA